MGSFSPCVHYCQYMPKPCYPEPGGITTKTRAPWKKGAAGVLLDTRAHSTQAGFVNKANLPRLGQTCLQTLQPIPKILPACTAPEMEL